MISPSSVLWGICHPVCKLRNPATLADELTITLPQVNRACQIFFDVEEAERRKSKSGLLRPVIEGCRVHLVFPYDHLTADEAIAWGKVFEGYLGGYRLIMIPHHDDGLKLDFDVLPEDGFHLGYVGDKYIAHTGTFTFINRALVPSLYLRTSVNVFSPRIHG